MTIRSEIEVEVFVKGVEASCLVYLTFLYQEGKETPSYNILAEYISTFEEDENTDYDHVEIYKIFTKDTDTLVGKVVINQLSSQQEEV